MEKCLDSRNEGTKNLLKSYLMENSSYVEVENEFQFEQRIQGIV